MRGWTGAPNVSAAASGRLYGGAVALAGHVRIRAVAAAVAQRHDELVGWGAQRRPGGLRRRLSSQPQLYKPEQRARRGDWLPMAYDLHLQSDHKRMESIRMHGYHLQQNW